MPDIKWTVQQIKEFVQLGPVGIIILLVGFVVAVVGIIGYAGHKGIWNWGKELDNAFKLLERSQQDLEEERKERRKERERTQEREDRIREQHAADIRVLQTAVMMQNRQIDMEQRQKERLVAIVEERAVGSAEEKS